MDENELIEKAARLAGEWWQNRLGIIRGDRERFGGAIAAAVAALLRERGRAEVSSHTFVPAHGGVWVERVLAELYGEQEARRATVPYATSMDVRPGWIYVHRDGEAVERIAVDPAQAAGVTVSHQLLVKDLEDLLTNAIEGGSTYWCQGMSCRPKAPDFACEVHAYEDPQTYTLSRDKLVAGLRLMAERYPQQFTAVLRQSDDADTADLLLQLALFGELVYS